MHAHQASLIPFVRDTFVLVLYLPTSRSSLHTQTWVGGVLVLSAIVGILYTVSHLLKARTVRMLLKAWEGEGVSE